MKVLLALLLAASAARAATAPPYNGISQPANGVVTQYLSGNLCVAASSATAGTCAINLNGAGGGAGGLATVTNISATNGALDVRAFGATGNGTTDDTAAIQAAFNYVTNNRQTGSLGVGYGSANRVYFSRGVYVVSSTITVPSYATIIGDRAILQAATTTFSTFLVNGYGVRIQGLVFVKGLNAISIQTGNADNDTITIDGCEFFGQMGSAVVTDTNSPSTKIHITDFHVYNSTPSATVFSIVSCDDCDVSYGWASVAGTFLQVGGPSNFAKVKLTGLLGVPIGGATVWGLNYGNLAMTGNRFGGEAGANIAVNYATYQTSADYSSLSIRENQVNTSSNYSVKFYGIPNQFIWRNNVDTIQSYNSTEGFWFSPSIANLTNVNSESGRWDVDDSISEGLFVQGSSEAAARSYLLNDSEKARSTTLDLSDKVLQIRANSGSYGQTGASANVTVVTGADKFGAPTYQVVGNSSTANVEFVNSFATALSGFATGIYTAMFNVDITSNMPVAIQFSAGDEQTQLTLQNGLHVVAVPFYFNAATSGTGIGYQLLNTNNTQGVTFGSIRVFKGEARSVGQNNVLYGGTAPTTLQWEVGDRIISTGPALGQPTAWTCVTAGTPGTWIVENAFANLNTTGIFPASVLPSTVAYTSITNIFTAGQQFGSGVAQTTIAATGAITMPNATNLSAKNTVGTTVGLLNVDGSNNVNIGATGSGANSVVLQNNGNYASLANSIFGIYSGNSLGVGTLTPATTLDVNGSAQFGTTAKSTFTTGGNLNVPGTVTSANFQLSNDLLYATTGGFLDFSSGGTGYLNFRNVNNSYASVMYLGNSGVGFNNTSNTANVVAIGTMTISNATAPPNSQALCLSSGQLGHCTGVVGVSGGCTCVAP